MKKFFLKGIIPLLTMMFSISFVNAQCSGNKVLMHRGRGCIEKCVPTSQFNNYISKGWTPGPCPIIFLFAQNSIKKMPNKLLINIPANYQAASKKEGKK